MCPRPFHTRCFIYLHNEQATGIDVIWTLSPIFFFKDLFLFYSLAVPGLCCCTWAFSGCSGLGAPLWVQCEGFSGWRLLFCGEPAPGTWTSVAVTCRLSSCGSLALEHRLSSCGTRVIRGTWDLPGSGIEPKSPTLAGGFFTIKPPGKFQYFLS